MLVIAKSVLGDVTGSVLLGWTLTGGGVIASECVRRDLSLMLLLMRMRMRILILMLMSTLASMLEGLEGRRRLEGGWWRVRGWKVGGWRRSEGMAVDVDCAGYGRVDCCLDHCCVGDGGGARSVDCSAGDGNRHGIEYGGGRCV